MTVFVQLYLVASIAAVTLAWLKGGHPERTGAVIWVIGWVLAMMVSHVQIGGLRWAVALVDIATFAAFLWLALGQARWWPLGVSACQLLVIVVHVLAFLVPSLTIRGGMSAELGLGVLIVLMLAGGTFERWLAGEAPASAMAIWTRGRRAT